MKISFGFFNGKRLLACLAVLVLVGAVFIFWPAAQKELTLYTITAEYLPETKQVKGQLEIRYQNNTGHHLAELLLQLYPNAYASQELAPFPPDRLSQAYPNGFTPGGITVSNITCNKKTVSGELLLQGVAMRLPVSLGAGGSVTFTMNFVIILPNSPGRFGYSEHTVNLGNWLPVVCVYENGAFAAAPYYSCGDPFYSECSIYNATITAPSSFVLAATGRINAKADPVPGKTAWHITAENVRDFAVILCKNYSVASRLAGDTIVYSYYFGSEDIGRKALDYAVTALELYTAAYGAYPYSSYSVAMADFFIGGMEYPGLVFIDQSCYQTDGLALLEEMIAHETAHQWWYSAVGSNQIKAAWLDEGLATFSTLYYYEKTRGLQNLPAYYRYYAENSYRFAREEAMRKYPELSERIDAPLTDYPDWQVYDMLCYSKAAIMIKTMREQMGDNAFFKAMQAYYAQNLFGFGTADELAAALQKETPLPIKEMLESWLSGKVVISFK